MTDETIQQFFHHHIQILSLLFNHNKKFGNYAIIKVNSKEDEEWLETNMDLHVLGMLLSKVCAFTTGDS